MWPSGFARLSLAQLELPSIVAPLAFPAVAYFLVPGPVHPIFHSWASFATLADILGPTAP